MVPPPAVLAALMAPASAAWSVHGTLTLAGAADAAIGAAINTTRPTLEPKANFPSVVSFIAPPTLPSRVLPTLGPSRRLVKITADRESLGVARSRRGAGLGVYGHRGWGHAILR